MIHSDRQIRLITAKRPSLAERICEYIHCSIKKDMTFNDLYDRMQFIQLCCYYIFLEEPEKFIQLGLPLIDNKSGALINARTKDMVKDSSIT